MDVALFACFAFVWGPTCMLDTCGIQNIQRSTPSVDVGRLTHIHDLLMAVPCRHLPVQKVAWQEVKGQQVLMGSFDEAVKAMNDMSFLSTLVNFPKEAINDETVELLQPYFAASVCVY